MDFVSPITEIISRVTGCSTKHLNYLRKLDENLNQLKEKMEQLMALKIDVNNKVIAEEARLMKRTNQVDEWMKRVDAKQVQVDQIILEGTQHLERSCLNGCCPKNCWHSYKLGKKVVKRLILVEELKRDGVFETVVENPPQVVTQELPETTPIVGLGSVFDRAWNFLGENSVRIMGLYGMGGVGKTTLLKRINNELSKRGTTFDIVIWVVISKEVNMARVQEDIGNTLGLSMSTTSNIFNVLKTKKFLLLLDDIWQRIDLLSIGVPSPSSYNKSKIVFTTRSETVCGCMEADKIIRVECLNWEASWTLFRDKVGYAALSSDPGIPSLAKIVAKECLGLPLALVTIGRSMARKKTRYEWECAISVLQKFAAEFPGMGDDVFPLLKFSYDSLPNDSVRLCFLFCALYPEDYSIEIPILIEQCIGEGYISGYDNFREAYNIGHDIIGILKGACLLEEAGSKMVDTVKMHDVIRDLALWIACEHGRKKDKYFVKAGLQLIEAPHAGNWPIMAEKISLFGNKINQLEKMPNCPNLKTLLLSRNFILRQIPNDFFLSMPALRFLDLSHTWITEVPSSICELFQLEFLDLSFTHITSFSYQMRNLIKLKYLYLRTLPAGCTIPRGTIKNFSNLEFLVVDHWFEIDELLFLKQLKSLEIKIRSDYKDVKKFLAYPKLANCTKKLSIIDCNDITSLSLSTSLSSTDLHLIDLKELQCVNIERGTNKSFRNGGLFESLETMILEDLPKLIISWDAHFRKLHLVRLDGCNAMVDLTWLLLIPNLQSLSISRCGSLEEVLSSSNKCGGAYSCDENTVISNLKVLKLHYLTKLKSICSIKEFPFPSLEYIEVKRCPGVGKLPVDPNIAINTLKKITGDLPWWNGLQWQDKTIKPQLAKIFTFFGSDAGEDLY